MANDERSSAEPAPGGEPVAELDGLVPATARDTTSAEPALFNETAGPAAETDDTVPRVAPPDGAEADVVDSADAPPAAESGLREDTPDADGEFFAHNYDATEAQPAIVEEKRRTPILGLAAFGATIVIGVVVAIAVSVAVDDQYELALGLAIVAIVGSILSFLVGAAAAILRQGRWWGVAAMVLSVLVNPLSLIQILDLFSWS